MNALDVAGHLIRRLHQHATQIFIQRTQAAGQDLTPVQFAALHVMAQRPGLGQADVAGWIAYDRATVGGVIERMVQKGWVHRVINPRDKRAREVKLTEAGARVHASLLPVVLALQDEILHPLDAQERACFLRLARRIIWPALADKSTEPDATPASAEATEAATPALAAVASADAAPNPDSPTPTP